MVSTKTKATHQKPLRLIYCYFWYIACTKIWQEIQIDIGQSLRYSDKGRVPKGNYCQSGLVKIRKMDRENVIKISIILCGFLSGWVKFWAKFYALGWLHLWFMWWLSSVEGQKTVKLWLYRCLNFRLLLHGPHGRRQKQLFNTQIEDHKFDFLSVGQWFLKPIGKRCSRYLTFCT